MDQDREQAYRDMIELIRRIADYIFADRKKVKERLGDIMGGKVLELESDKLIKLGRAEGRAEGKAEGKIQMLKELVKDGTLSVVSAAAKVNMTAEQFKKELDKEV